MTLWRVTVQHDLKSINVHVAAFDVRNNHHNLVVGTLFAQDECSYELTATPGVYQIITTAKSGPRIGERHSMTLCVLSTLPTLGVMTATIKKRAPEDEAVKSPASQAGGSGFETRRVYHSDRPL